MSTAPRQIPLTLFWRRFTLRHLREDWLQTGLLMLILALGVGTFQSIRLANRAAVEGFRLFTESLSGTSDFILTRSGPGIPLSDLPAIRDRLHGIPANIYPVMERALSRPANESPSPLPDGESIRLLGLDLVQFSSTGVGGGLDSEEDFWSLLDDPNHLLLSPAIAKKWQLGTDHELGLVMRGQVEPFVVRGRLPEFLNGRPVPENLAVMDIGALLDRENSNHLDRVEIIIQPGPLREEFLQASATRLRTLEDRMISVRSNAERQIEATSMTAAFRLNLTVLSLIALLIGVYLIAQTLDATVSRRRREIASLRSLGISSREIYRLWMSEALLYGIAASLLGLGAGYLMAGFTVDAVTTTVRSLYQDTVRTAVGLRVEDVVLCFSLGLGASFAAAWLPARDAASTPPAQFLRLGKRIPPFPVFQHPWIGAIAIVLGLALLWLPPIQPRPGTSIPAAGYATAFLWLVGGTLLAAAGIKWIGWLIRVFSRSSPVFKLAGSRLSIPTSRHQLALSGFFVAIGMASAIAFLISSFEHTITGWLNQRLRADLFISSTGFKGSDSDQRMAAVLLEEIEALPGVHAMDRYRSLNIRIDQVPTTLGGVRFDMLGKEQELLWITGPENPAQLPSGVETIGYANENLIRRTGLKMGDVVEITTPGGNKTILLSGIHADYARDNGLLLIDLKHLEDWYGINHYDTASVFLSEPFRINTVKDQLRQSYPGLNVRDNQELKEAALFIFEQTFAVTRALQAIGLLVALSGLSLSLLSLLRESGKELALQKTLGMSRHKIAATTAVEGMGIALTGLLLGLFLSIGLGLVLIYVINRQSFGWTLQAAFPVWETLRLSAAVLTLGLAISYATGWLFISRWKQEAI